MVSAGPSIISFGSSNISGSYKPVDTLEINAVYDEALLSGSFISVLLNNNVSLTLDNLTTKISPRHEGSISNGNDGAVLDNPVSVYVKDNYAYIAVVDSDTLEIVDISDPSNPQHKGSYIDSQNLSRMRDVFVSGNYAYGISGDRGTLEIIDVSDPGHPVHAGRISDGENGAILNYSYSVYVSGNYAYVAIGGFSNNALEIVNISDPSAPSHVANVSDGENGAMLSLPKSVFVPDGYAYVASSGSDALEIINVSNPAAPAHAASVTNGVAGAMKYPLSVFVSGDYAYVVCRDSYSLEIINVSNPGDPVPEGAISYSNLDYSSVFVSGGYAYLTRYQDDVLEIIDVSVPSNPVSVANISNDNLNGVRSVFVSGGMAYLVSSLSKTLEIVSTGYSTLSGTYNVGTGEATPLLNVGLITAHDAISLDGMRTNSSKNLPPENLADSVRIEITDPLNASFDCMPLSGTAPLTVTFTDTSTGSPASWNWSFGDGLWFNTTDPASKNPHHEYSIAGNYTVSLNVSNASDSNTYTLADYIVVGTSGTSPPASSTGTATATITASPTATLTITPGSSSGSLHSSSRTRGESNTDTGTGFAENLNAGENVSFEMDKGAIYKVSITPVTNLRKLMITIRRDSSVPSSINTPDTDVYEYEFADLYYAGNSDLSGGTFWFKVKKSWITAGGYSSNDIVMLCYNEEAGEWEELKITYAGEEGACYYYTADISSFSLFAITISEGETMVLEETTPKVLHSTVKGTEKTVRAGIPASSVRATASGVSQINTDSSKRNSSWMSFAIPVILVILGVVIIIGLTGRKKYQKYPDWWDRDLK
ncbi:PGF-pre-PGF domain-containing protein [Methanolacinia petrolearia]|nr:PGF-pre-PGF domain-containing protein [Methanolacinia petrolearia]